MLEHMPPEALANMIFNNTVEALQIAGILPVTHGEKTTLLVNMLSDSASSARLENPIRFGSGGTGIRWTPKSDFEKKYWVLLDSFRLPFRFRPNKEFHKLLFNLVGADYNGYMTKFKFTDIFPPTLELVAPDGMFVCPGLDFIRMVSDQNLIRAKKMSEAAENRLLGIKMRVFIDAKPGVEPLQCKSASYIMRPIIEGID
jgi:hypothetical protein